MALTLPNKYLPDREVRQNFEAVDERNHYTAWNLSTLFLNVKTFGARGDGVTDDTDAINEAIDTLPDEMTLYFPPGEYVVSADLNTLTGTDIAIRGGGQGATTIRQSSAAGTFFESTGNRVRIADLNLRATATQPTGPAFDFPSGADKYVTDCRVQTVGQVAEIGATSSVARAVFSNISGSVYAGTTSDWWRLHAGTAFRAHNCQVSSATPGTALTNDSAYVHIGSSVGVCDTMHFTNCNFFQQPGAGGTTAKPRGFRIDASSKAVNNLWVITGVFDGTHDFAVHIRGDSDIESMRNHNFIGNRFETADGEVINFDYTDTGSKVAQEFKFHSNTFFFGNGNNTDTPVTVAGANVSGFSIAGNHFLEQGTGVKGACWDMAIDDFTISDNIVHKTSGSAVLDVDYLLETSADVDNFIVTGNTCRDPNTRWVNHYSYATPSADRIVRNNTPKDTASIASASTITLPDGTEVFTITGTSDISTITASHPHRIVTLRFTGTAGTNGVVDGSNLKLNGNFAYTPDDTLTLVCDGTDWYQAARSAN